MLRLRLRSILEKYNNVAFFAPCRKFIPASHEIYSWAVYKNMPLRFLNPTAKNAKEKIRIICAHTLMPSSSLRNE